MVVTNTFDGYCGEAHCVDQIMDGQSPRWQQPCRESSCLGTREGKACPQISLVPFTRHLRETISDTLVFIHTPFV